MRDYSDYYQYSWKLIKPPLPPLVNFLFRLPAFILILFLGLFVFLPHIINQIDQPGQILYTLFIISLCLILVLGLNFILNRLAKARPPQLINCRIDKSGITINRDFVPYSSLDTSTAITLINSTILPQNQWTLEPQSLSMSLPSTKISLHFPNETSRQQALAALKHYLTP